MWTVVYMTKDEGNIALLKKKIQDDGILVILRKSEEYFELLVPSCEVSLAHNIIIETEI